MKKGVVVEKLKRRAFTAEFKIEAVKLVTESGLGYAEVGRRLDVLPKLIRTWENTYRAGRLIAGAPRLRVTAEQMELSKLRKEVQELKKERDVLKNYVVTLQSRFGKAKWLEAYTAPMLKKLGKAGVKRIDIVCPGFAADCLETLEEKAIEGRAIFLSAAGKDYHPLPQRARHLDTRAHDDCPRKPAWMVARGMGCRESQAGWGSQPCPCERDGGETLVRRLDDGFRFALPILRIGAAWLARRMGRAPAKPIAPPPLASAAPDAGEKVARRGLSRD